MIQILDPSSRFFYSASLPSMRQNRKPKLGANVWVPGAELFLALSKDNNRQDANFSEALLTHMHYLAYLPREGVISKLSGPASARTLYINIMHTSRTLEQFKNGSNLTSTKYYTLRRQRLKL